LDLEEISLIPETHGDLLDWDTKAFAHLATLGPEGEPQNNPVWFDWDGDVIKTSHTTKRQKYANFQRDGRVALSIVDPKDPYRYLEVRGKVVGFDPDPDLAFINRLAMKYLGEEVNPWNQPGDERVTVRIRPHHTTTMGG
jgi:PPOX class probable F420-dependent enzyme